MFSPTSNNSPLMTPAAAADGYPGTRPSLRRHSIRDVVWVLRRAGSRGMVWREPSALVRQAAAVQMDERQSDWAYSKPVVILDLVWNFAFVLIAAAVLVLSRDEQPELPLRLWIVGYALQCVLHAVSVSLEYRKRRRRRWQSADEAFGRGGEGLNSSTGYVTLAQFTQEETSTVAKYLESINTMFSFVWWIIGFYWASVGGQPMAQDSPQLYWASIIFLAFDVFFVVFCIILACVIGLGICCCLPCILAVLYAVADQLQDGADQEDIEQLSKYTFTRTISFENADGEAHGSIAGVMTLCGVDVAMAMAHQLSVDDAECCICLSAYEDGAELRQLPCGHHFHCACADKWLQINATCPLCKNSIIKGSYHRSGEV
nr:E3 ubiquitin-protein ligase At1g12760-like isoform X1 [Ipomoea batatas]